RDTVDTGRAYRWSHPDGSGRFLTVAVFDGPLSRGVAFGDATRDAATFVSMARASAARSRVSEPPLVLCASDGELFGHHKKFADLNLAFTTFVEGPKHGIEPTNLGAYLQSYPATWEMALAEGPDGRGTSWSCAHGVGRWWRDCGCTMVATDRGWNHRWRTPLRTAMDALQVAAAEFYEDAAAPLLHDPWGVRDAYGDVVDAPAAERDALLEEFGTTALLNGGDEARARVRHLLEMQRATLLMYASCGWYFDDIAGLETSLVLRLAAHAADLMNEAGGKAPLDEMLDLLAAAKSNEAGGQTGADVFRRGAADRVTPKRAVAAAALAFGTGQIASRAGTTSVPLTPGFDVQIVSPFVGGAQRPVTPSGQARVTHERLGVTEILDFEVVGDDRPDGVLVKVDGSEVHVPDLGRESRHRLFPLLLPWILETSRVAPLPAARLALDLGKDVLGGHDASEDVALRRGYAQVLVHLLLADTALSDAMGTVALQLFEAAGAEIALGTAERAIVEELVAEKLTARLNATVVSPSSSSSSRDALTR
ncbi:MAG: DUF3536 domain-containing protein, partial [Deltaproteobacteria bacterium]|nr:DUF3536 domain-containing protein [Deltaproteobacteria bacterium]